MPRKSPLNRIVVPLLLLAIVASGCRKHDDAARWDVDVLAPLITSSLSIKDILSDTLLVTDGSGNISLVYRSELFAVDLDTVLRIPDTTYFHPGTIPFPGPIFFPPGTGIVDDDNVTRFDFGDLRLRRLIVQQGTVEFELRNTVGSDVIGSFTLPGALFPDGDQSLSARVGAGGPAAPMVIRQARDLAGVDLDLRGPQYNAVNTLHSVVAINLAPDGEGATMTNQDSVNATVSYIGIRPAYARGYFGERTLTVEHTESELELFKNIVAGTLDVDDVTLRVKLTNGLGMDIQVALAYLRGIHSNTGNTVDLGHTLLQGPINLARAMDMGNGATPTVYENSMDRTDSNVDLFIENLPDKVAYAMDVHLNPLGDISNGNDFIYADSKVSAELELEVPLRLIASGLTLHTFLDLDLPKGLSECDLHLFATNGFPFKAELLADVVDPDGQVLSSLNIQGGIPSGLVGTDGLVHTPVNGRSLVPLAQGHIAQLRAGGRMRLHVVFDTADQDRHLRLMDHYKLDLQVVLGANYMVNGE